LNKDSRLIHDGQFCVIAGINKYDSFTGWNDNPIARRVRCIPEDYYLLTNRFRCSDRRAVGGCGKRFQGTDPTIIAQLPQFVALAFPGMCLMILFHSPSNFSRTAYLSACGAIDKVMMSMMSNTFATRLGPSPFSELVSELQYKHHTLLELMYTHAARHYRLHGSAQIPPFSPFADSMRYAGRPPSVQYLKSMFVDWTTAYRPYME
jgi:hypothetical protein